MRPCPALPGPAKPLQDSKREEEVRRLRRLMAGRPAEGESAVAADGGLVINEDRMPGEAARAWAIRCPSPKFPAPFAHQPSCQQPRQGHAMAGCSPWGHPCCSFLVCT